MLDTRAVARALADADFTPAQADAVTVAVRQAAEHAGPADRQIAAIDARLSRIDSRLDRIDARIDALTWRFAGATAAQTLAIIGAPSSRSCACSRPPDPARRGGAAQRPRRLRRTPTATDRTIRLRGGRAVGLHSA